MRIAVLSDTHGLLRPQALQAVQSADHILHAGDVGDIRILEALREVAPVTAIRGNVDLQGPCSLLPETEAVELGGVLLYMLHSVDDLDLKPEAAGIGVVVFGHSHQPSLRERNGVLYLNPGSCGPRRFSLPIAMAWLTIVDRRASAELIELTA
jgi:putative phosphoesterase